MFPLPDVPTADEVVDVAFRRAGKATAKGTDRTSRARNLAAARVRTAGGTVTSTLRRVVRGFPSLARLPPFQREMVDILVDQDALKKHLGAVDWAAGKAAEVTRDYLRRTGQATPKDFSRLRKEAYGRLSSIVHQVSRDLEALRAARKDLGRVPTIDANLPTIVVAGYPNVGKSAFVRAVSSGRPKVAAYPFTTQLVSLGHLEVGTVRVQVLDTPGLLDRPMDDRNRIERQAIAALTHLADAIVFLLDPSGTCGYPMEHQLALLEAIKVTFAGIPIVVVENKSDLAAASAGYPRMSCLTGDGVQDALGLAVRAITSLGPEGGPRRAGP